MPIIEEKPCPFCGSLKLNPMVVDIEDKEGFPTIITCTDCGAEGPMAYCKSMEDCCPAIQAWNRRV